MNYIWQQEKSHMESCGPVAVLPATVLGGMAGQDLETLHSFTLVTNCAWTLRLLEF